MPLTSLDPGGLDKPPATGHLAFMSDTSKRLFIFGFGFSAKAFADRMRKRGYRIAATCRSEEKRVLLANEGIEAFIFDRDTPLLDATAALKGSTHLLSSVPPDADGDPVLNQHAQDIAAAGPFEWVGYLSTTGVYGDRQGGWVDEGSALEPTGERGQRRVSAEAEWQSLTQAHCFRLAGIYGPGRSALDTVRKGRARRVVKPGQVFSRIHIDDIAQILEASVLRPNPGAAYNVCDDAAAPPQDVITYACTLLGIDPPPEIPFDQAELSPMARSFYADNKRVDNSRIKEELGVQLKWPEYRAALKAML